ncbi:MAG: pseudouridine synthase [Candidatus Bruticola sp.]
MKVRLDKLLASRGLCRRSETEKFLRSGEVVSLKEQLKRADQKVESADILFRGEPVGPEKLYVLMYKPQGYVCSRRDAGPLVYELLPEHWSRRVPALESVGRLDKDTTGALLFTNDGPLLHKLIAPKHHKPKVYEVWLERPVNDEQVQLLRGGGLVLTGESKPLKPAPVLLLPAYFDKYEPMLSLRVSGELIDPACNYAWAAAQSNHLLMTLTEGRYHQVKRMFACLDNEVLRLHRVSFADLDLTGLQIGQYRCLIEEEILQLLN